MPHLQPTGCFVFSELFHISPIHFLFRYFHLQLKDIPLLYILIKSHWNAVVFQSLGIKLSFIPTHEQTYSIGANQIRNKNLFNTQIHIFQDSLLIPNVLIMLVPIIFHFPPAAVIYFSKQQCNKRTKENIP